MSGRTEEGGIEKGRGRSKRSEGCNRLDKSMQLDGVNYGVKYVQFVSLRHISLTVQEPPMLTKSV